jgi:HlyD family secretion protein
MRLLRQRSGKVWLGAAGVAVLAIVLGLFWLTRGKAPEANAQEYDDGQATSGAVEVNVVKAQAGGLERTGTWPGTVRAFESAGLYPGPKVSGFLIIDDTMDVDTKVKKGEILAKLDAPELLRDKEHAEAALDQARSQKDQMVAHIVTAKAELKTAHVVVDQRKAEVGRAEANLHYREKQYVRIKELEHYGSVDQRLVDESHDQLETAQAWKETAVIQVKTAQADVSAKEAKVEQARADLRAAEAQIRVADAALKKAEVFVEYTNIRSPYDGVVTERNYHNGAFIKSGDQGTQRPVLVVQRVDKMRLIIQVPDADAELCDPGDPVDFAITTSQHKFPQFKVTLVSRSQDQKTRTTRVEVHIDNKNGKLRDGMYGDATIHLQKGRKDAFCVPSSALRRIRTKTVVYVVRDEVAHEIPVQVGQNDGTTAEILTGLRAGDLVIDHPNAQVQDGVAVQVAQEG